MTHLYNFYNNLLDKLNVPNYIDVYGKIINEDFEFYNQYFKINQKLQLGGGKTTNIKYSYDNRIFTIFKVEEDDRISFSIYNKSDELSDVCMMMFIPKKDNYIYLETISYYDNCSVPEMPKTKGGSLLLKLTLKYIDEIRDKYDLKYIQLRDTGNFTCHQIKKKTPICNLYMLTRGDTWYGKYGFTPFDPVTKQPNYDVLVDYKLNQKLVKIIKVKHTQIYQYVKKASYKPQFKNFTNQIINKIFDAYNERTIQDFFKDFINNYDERCDIFNEIYKDVMSEIGMVDLYNKVYYRPL